VTRVIVCIFPKQLCYGILCKERVGVVVDIRKTCGHVSNSLVLHNEHVMVGYLSG
jgi:hypothetical protein